TYWFSRIGTVPGLWNPVTNAYTPVTGFPVPDCRDQGVAVLLYPAQAQREMVIGGGCRTGVTASTGLITLGTATTHYTTEPNLPWGAMHLCGPDLADGTLFVSGGSDHNPNPRLAAATYRPGATSWTPMASPTVARMYHSSCLLLPDGRVLTTGSNVAPPLEPRPGAVSPADLSRAPPPDHHT